MQIIKTHGDVASEKFCTTDFFIHKDNKNMIWDHLPSLCLIYILNIIGFCVKM